MFKINTRPLKSALTSLESVVIPNSTSPGNIVRLLIADKQGDHDIYRNMPPSNATKKQMLKSLDLRNANSTMMTDHMAVKSNELLQLEDDLRKLRHQNEEFQRQAIQAQIKQEREKLRTIMERIIFDTETPQYIA